MGISLSCSEMMWTLLGPRFTTKTALPQKLRLINSKPALLAPGWWRLRQRLFICRTIYRPQRISCKLKGDSIIVYNSERWMYTQMMLTCLISSFVVKISFNVMKSFLMKSTVALKQNAKDALMQVWICLGYNPPTNSSISSSSLLFSCNPTHFYSRTSSLISPVLLQWNARKKQFKSLRCCRSPLCEGCGIFSGALWMCQRGRSW